MRRSSIFLATMSDIKNNTGSKSDGRKEASYPLYPLDEALTIAEAIRDLGGSRMAVSKALLAKHLHYAETGPSFVQRIASAKSFGMIDGWGTYSLTEHGKRFFYPTNDSDKKMALLYFLSYPAVFKALIQRFDGEKLPNNELIGNILHQNPSIPASWKDRLASMFVRSAQHAQIIDANGFLRFSDVMQGEPVLPEQQPSVEAAPAAQSYSIKVTPQGQPQGQSVPGTTVWAFRHSSGQFSNVIRLETPENMSKELWEKLDAYVQILKPSQNE
jgi:hypothetical protein